MDKFVTECSGETYEDLLLDRNRYSQLGYYPALLINRSPVRIHHILDRNQKQKLNASTNLPQTGTLKNGWMHLRDKISNNYQCDCKHPFLCRDCGGTGRLGSIRSVLVQEKFEERNAEISCEYL